MTPEIATLLGKLWGHMHERYYETFAQLSDAQAQALMYNPTHKGLMLAIDTEAIAGNEQGTRDACRTYVAYWRDALKPKETP